MERGPRAWLWKLLGVRDGDAFASALPSPAACFASDCFSACSIDVQVSAVAETQVSPDTTPLQPHGRAPQSLVCCQH